jgi:hypothetical protein
MGNWTDLIHTLMKDFADLIRAIALKDWADLIRAIATLLWPLLVFAVVWMFKEQVREILGRLRRGKVLGQEIELEERLRKLDESAQTAASETPSPVSVPETHNEVIARESELADVTRHILDEASRSPKVALMLLASELEREVYQILASKGLLHELRRTSLPQAIEVLERRGALPRHLAESVRNFYGVRSSLVHGQDATQDDIIRAIDSGLTILRTIQAIPRRVNIVYHPGVEVYSDPEGKNIREGVKAVVLESTSPGGALKTFLVYPTTRTHFQKGKRVAWEWNESLIFSESWYKHPDTDKITLGWNESMEFVGRHLEDI